VVYFTHRANIILNAIPDTLIAIPDTLIAIPHTLIALADTLIALAGTLIEVKISKIPLPYIVIVK